MLEKQPEDVWDDIRAHLPPATHAPADCTHQNFASFIAVNRFEDSGLFNAEIRLCCVDCHEPMRFKGLPAGVNFRSPTTSIDGLVVMLPCEPEIEKRFADRASYQMPVIPARH